MPHRQTKSLTKKKAMTKKKAVPKKKVVTKKKSVIKKKSVTKKKSVIKKKSVTKKKGPEEELTWKTVIKKWKNGEDLPDIKRSVFWETSRAHSKGSSLFIQTTTSASKHLPMSMKADSSPFRNHLDGKTSPVRFYNLDKSAILVSPPDIGKNYSHLATFYKNSSTTEKNDFWRKVAKSIEKELNKGNDVYVSTHGTNVHWLHVRIETNPKYYVSDLKYT